MSHPFTYVVCHLFSVALYIIFSMLSVPSLSPLSTFLLVVFPFLVGPWLTKCLFCSFSLPMWEGVLKIRDIFAFSVSRACVLVVLTDCIIVGCAEERDWWVEKGRSSIW